jgi:hypothetical protein
MKFSWFALKCRFLGMTHYLLPVEDYNTLTTRKGKSFSMKQQRKADEFLANRLREDPQLRSLLPKRPFVIDFVFADTGEYLMAVFDPRDVEKYNGDRFRRRHVQYARRPRLQGNGHFRYIYCNGKVTPISQEGNPVTEIAYREPLLVIRPDMNSPFCIDRDYDRLVAPTLPEYLHAIAR